MTTPTEHSTLTAISPLDGRYAHALTSLRDTVSEYGLIYFRTLVEIEWLITLCPILQPALTIDPEQIRTIILNFSHQDAAAIKTIEQRTNHDVKAVEYFIADQLRQRQLDALIPMVHFGCTSEDINNLAYALMFKAIRETHLLPHWQQLIDTLTDRAQQWATMPMLSRTHGQAASPTTLGKEIQNVVARLQRQQHQLAQQPILGKCNGAVGNFNAHHVTYPDIDWPTIGQRFVEGLGLVWNPLTTQIEPHDWLAEALHTLMRFNTILIDFDRDIWGYIAQDYFSQKKNEQEVGSSTMPHKINPIDFENSEGNLGIANALADHLANKLPISRWQRDLTDSTVLRNIGSIIGYAVLSYKATLKGMNKLIANEAVMAQSLDQHWSVLAEAIQSVMRRYGIADAYEQLKAVSRGQPLNATQLRQFIAGINIPDNEKSRLQKMTPADYIGYAAVLATTTPKELIE